MVKVFLLADFTFELWRIFERRFAGLFTPVQQFHVVFCPVSHHATGESAGDDVVHVFLEQRCHDLFQLLRQRIGTQFGRVGQAIHHQGDTALLQRFGDGFPAELDQFFCISRVSSFSNQFVEAQQRTRLQHAAQNGLLAHQV
ncbi:hypothetical protein D3C78_912780 [compost metagenome]